MYNTKKSWWNDQFDILQQGKKSVEEYNEKFLRLWRKVNPNEQYPIEVLFRKYIRRLKSAIGVYTYTQIFEDLQEAMDTAIRYSREQEMLKGNINYMEEIEDLKHQINMLKLDVDRLKIVWPVERFLPSLNCPYENQAPRIKKKRYNQ